MGMDAELIAIGKFKKSIAWNLEYPKAFYEDTPEDSEIITHVFSCGTSDASKELASMLGIDPWKFEEHKVDLGRVDFGGLADFCLEHGVNQLWADFNALKEAGFTFWYMPNG